MAYRELNKKDYTVGQEVALRYSGNASRRAEKNAYRLGIITKIGTKIIYVNDDLKVNMETGMEKSNYTPNFIFYDSEQHLLDTVVNEGLIDELRKKIGRYGYPDIPLEKMKQVMAILKED